MLSKSIVVTAILAICLITPSAQAAVINFDDISVVNIPKNYLNLSWDKIYTANKHTQAAPTFTLGTTSGDIAAWSAYPIATIKAPLGETFDVGSANFTSAYVNQTVQFQGYKLGSRILGTIQYNLTTTQSLAINIDFQDIDELRIISTQSQHWIMDDLEITADFIPEPTSALTLCISSLILIARRKI